MQSWYAVWNQRSGDSGADPLQFLIELDGFDSGAGRIDAQDWRAYARDICKRLRLGAGESVYEVGCGAGAFLYALRELGMQVGGLDYSSALIQHARAAMSDAEFQHGEACHLEMLPRYDVVLANSVFHYFSDLQYAEEVLDRMLNKAERAVAILEVPDLSTRDEAERIRRDILSPADYEKKYRGLEHQYYAREWFHRQAAKRGLSCQAFDQCISNYAQSSYRFNCLISK